MEETNNYDLLNNSLRDKEIEESARLIIEIYSRDADSFCNNLLLSGVLPEPLQMDFEDNVEVLNTFFLAVLKVPQISVENEWMDLVTNCNQLVDTILQLYKMNKSNISELEKDGLFDIPFKRTIHMLCVFLENQDRLTSIELLKKFKESKYIDPLEGNLASVTLRNGGRISLADNIEGGIEIVKLLIELLYYKARGEMVNEYEQHDNVSPYGIPNIEKINLLGAHRHTLNFLWEKIKYRDWKYRIIKREDDKYYYFEPEKKLDFRLERAGNERSFYKDRVDSFSSIEVNRESFLSFHSFIKLMSKNIDIYNVRTLFQGNDEDIRKCVQGMWEENRKHMEELNFIDESFLLNKPFGNKKNINFDLFLNFIFYLQVLARIYSNRTHEGFDDHNPKGYKVLAPIVKKQWIIDNFSELYGHEKDIISEVLDLLIFRRRPRKQLSDLFSQPLVYISKDEVIFVPALWKQLNIVRMIEQQIEEWDVKISKKGFAFENEIRAFLKFCPELVVNTMPIKFDAFDDKPAEFDFLGLFEDKILLIEMKCLSKQYSSKEYYLREKEVLYGVEQVKRRVEVLKHDWEKVKELANITLPIQPPTEEDIIKVVCLNLFDFTGKQVDGVSIIDHSMLLKYFLSGEVYAKSIGASKSEIIKEVSIWSKGYPTVDGFIEFLRMPIALKGFYNNLKEQPRPIMLINEDDPKILYSDFSLIENPFKKDIDELINYSKQQSLSRTKKKEKKVDKRKLMNKQKKRDRKKNR